MTEGLRLQNQILLALTYSAQFQYPLYPYEIWCQLLGKTGNGHSFLQVIECLHVLCDLKLIEKHRGFYTIRGNRGFAVQRIARTKFSQTKRLKAKPLLQFLALLPWVQAVAVTGSVAVQNAELDDDVDFCIVVENGSLWLVRPIVVFFAWLHGKRRSWRSEEHNSWCFNLWLEQTTLLVDQGARSIYTAREVLQADWVLDRGMIRSKFLGQNAWVRSVFPNWHSVQVNTGETNPRPSVFFTISVGLLACTKPIWLLCNHILFGLQRLYMHPHQTRERVALRYAYFHPRDTRTSISENWKKWMAKIGNGDTVADTILTMKTAGELPKKITTEIASVRNVGKKIVLVTGVFDILHEEHVVFLEKAALLGDYLLVAIESDERVRQLKGMNRPMYSAILRAVQLKNIPIVSNVVVLPSSFSKPQDHQQFLSQVKPDFFAVSSQSAHLDAKSRAVTAVGGSLVIVHEHVAGVSTTDFVERERYTTYSTDSFS